MGKSYALDNIVSFTLELPAHSRIVGVHGRATNMFIYDVGFYVQRWFQFL
jgi:hypothetical protein